MAAQDPSDYERGVIAGAIESRLDDHDEHLDRINGSMGDVARELHSLVLAVQRLADQAVARDATVITTASALKDAEEARRNTSEQKWTPMARALTVVGVLLTLAGLIVTVAVLNR